MSQITLQAPDKQKANKPSAIEFLLTPKSPQYIFSQELTERTHANGSQIIGKEQRGSIRIFKLNSNTSEFNAFQNNLIPAFRNLDWDLYDIRRAEIALIEAKNTSLSKEDHDLLLSYYRGKREQKDIDELLNLMSPEEKNHLSKLKPARKKACSQFKVALQDNLNTWFVEQQQNESITQYVNNSDYRSIARKYNHIPADIIEHNVFQECFGNVIHMVKEARPDAKAMQIVVWMMSCYTWAGVSSTNSPEGIHQDGADYVVSAFVIERDNVTGGKSMVYGSDKKTIVMSHTLDTGEGLFQTDTSSSLWHTVSAIDIADSQKDFGVRSILGFDVHIL